jgi:hypothetical protein
MTLYLARSVACDPPVHLADEDAWATAPDEGPVIAFIV